MMLEFKNVSKIYHKDGQVIRVPEAFSLSAERGDYVAVTGPSGCGKTTLLLTAGGLLRPDRGQMLVNGTDIYQLPIEQRASFSTRNIGFLFQQYHLIPYLSVMEKIRVPSLAHKQGVSSSRFDELVERLGLTKRLKHTPSELSAGEKQRTALARALLYDPLILFADEITGNLDPVNVDIVMNCLAEYNRAGGTILLVSHDLAVSKKANRIVEL